MEKRIGLLTFHSAHNYGAVLQCYSTITFLHEKGFEIETIDYQNKSLAERYKKRSPLYFINPKNLYRIIKYNQQIKTNNTFDDFIQNKLCLSSSKYDEETINNVTNIYSDIIVGSDQVWNYDCNGNDISYFLPFANDNTNSVALSASIGGNINGIISSKETIDCLKRFSKISVREDDDCKQLGKLLGKPIENTLDPVFLLEKNQWKLLQDESISSKYNDYILVYTIVEDKELLSFIQKNYPSYKVLYINQGYIKRTNVVNLTNVNPQQFLGLIMNAKMVFTNSFHGIAFSLIFEKEFGVALLKYNERINNRISSLLEKANALDHILSNSLKTNAVKSEVLDAEKDNLKKYLLSAIK